MKDGRIRVLVLCLTDLISVFGAWVVAIWSYRAVGLGHYANGVSFYLNLWPIPFAFVVFNLLFRLYHGNALYPAAPVSPVEELRRLVASAAFSHLGLVSFLALSRQTTEDYSRAVIVISGILTAICAQPARDFARKILKWFGIGQIPVFLAGGGAAAKHAAKAIENDSYLGFRVVRTFAENWHLIVPEASQKGVKILIACQDERVFKVQIEELTTWFTFIEYLPTVAIFPIYGAQPIVFDGVGGLEMVNQRRMRAMRFGKSVLDRILSVVAFTVLLPFFIVLPILIKLGSKGPVFYRAQRLGKNGRPIRVWKFRSMYVDADERLSSLLSSDAELRREYEANFKLANDPRVTPLGRWLRKTSLDEIPQLFNVFTGEMALIGPRPIVEKEVAYYGRDYPLFSSVKPGITGLWQVSGRSSTDYPRRVALDVYYVLNWSPWMDIWILLRTVSAVLFMRGAC